MITSSFDKLQYAFTTLKNGLKVLLVHHPNSVKCATCLRVSVGHASDPLDAPGLAHFCEHMLFLGTKEYPVEGEYKSFISQNGGSCNAATGAHYTQYHFDINHEHLEGALDRFSKFFTTPLFHEDAVNREIRAIENEHQRNIPQDGRRWNNILKRCCNPEHPYSKFGTGNTATLAIPNIREKLLSWYAETYCATKMNLCIVSQRSLVDLAAFAERYFSNVPRKECALTDEVQVTPLFLPDQMNTMIWYHPLKQQPRIIFSFPLPLTLKDDSSQKLIHFLCGLLGHEGPGSILYHLKYTCTLGDKTECGAQDHSPLVRYAVCGASQVDYKGSALLQLDLTLTEQGQFHLNTIVSVVARYLQLLRNVSEVASPANADMLKNFYCETKKMLQHSFHWKDSLSCVDTAVQLASQMADFPNIEDYVYGPYRMDGLDLSELLRVSKALEISNCRIGIWQTSEEAKKVFFSSLSDSLGLTEKLNCCNPSANLEQIDPMYQSRYSIYPLPPEWLKYDGKENTDFEAALPDPNPYIPHDTMNMHFGDHKRSLLVQCNDTLGCVQYHSHDPDFRDPKACILTRLLPPDEFSPQATPRMGVMYIILEVLLRHSIHDYNATLAGISFNFSISQGITLSTYGYTPKLRTFTEDLLKRLIDIKFKPELLMMSLEEVRDRLVDDKFTGALHHATSSLLKYMYRVHHKAPELLDEIDSITLDDVQTLKDDILRSCEVEQLLYGSLDAPEETYMETFRKMWSDRVNWHVSPDEKRLHNFEKRMYSFSQRVVECSEELCVSNPNPNDKNSAFLLYIPITIPHTELVAASVALRRWLHPRYFKSIRTQQQLCYQVFFRHRIDHNILGLEFGAVSSTHSARYLYQQTMSFLSVELPKDIDDETFEAIKDSTLKDFEEPFHSVTQAADYTWHEISRGTKQMNRRAQLVESARLLEKKDVLELLSKILCDETKKIVSLCESQCLGGVPTIQESNKLDNGSACFHPSFVLF